MKKVLNVMAAAVFVLSASAALAGGPGKKMGPGCPEACQQQIDDLQSSQAQQNEQLGAHGKQLQNHEERIVALEKALDNLWYVRLGVRASWVTQDAWGNDEWDTDTGFGGAIAFGREFGNFRAELELGKQGADLEDLHRTGLYGGWANAFSGDIDITTVMVNGYYELPVVDAFSLYAMAGLGFAKYDMDTTRLVINEADNSVDSIRTRNGSDNVFAYKAGVGMTYNFTEQIAGDLGYEYLGVADTDLATSINGHNVVASVRFKF